MNADAHMLKEIEELEEWFRTQCHDVASADLKAIHQVVRCALDEQRYAPQLVDQAPAALAGTIKDRLRAELGRDGQSEAPLPRVAAPHTGRRKLPVILRWSAGISAAAALVAMWITLPQPNIGPQTDPAEVDAYVAYVADDMDMALDELGADIAMLETGWSGALPYSLGSSNYDNLLDDVSDIEERM